MGEAPLVVVGGKESWPGGAVEALLRGHGYSLQRHDRPSELVRVIRERQPDLVLLTAELRGADGLGLCRQLRQHDWFATTPLFFLCSDGRSDELAALEAGAWDAVSCPPDPRLFLARVRNAVDTKRRADEAMSRGMIDHVTGCYNRTGLATRLQEEMLHARRHDEPLAFLAVQTEHLDRMLLDMDDPADRDAALRSIVSVLRFGCRRTDVLGRPGGIDFAIVAPVTGRAGSQGLAARLGKAFQSSPLRIGSNGDSAQLRPIVGITTRTRWPEDEEAPETLIEEAAEALQNARRRGSGYWLHS